MSGDRLQKVNGEPIVPPDVQHFVLERIGSIAQLEALLMMRDAPDTWWPSNAMAERLYISEFACRSEMEALCQQALTVGREEPGGWAYRYAPSSGELREFVDRLAYYYAHHLVPISNLIHSKPRTRIQEFAQAFWLKKDKA